MKYVNISLMYNDLEEYTLDSKQRQEKLPLQMKISPNQGRKWYITELAIIRRYRRKLKKKHLLFLFNIHLKSEVVKTFWMKQSRYKEKLMAIKVMDEAPEIKLEVERK